MNKLIIAALAVTGSAMAHAQVDLYNDLSDSNPFEGYAAWDGGANDFGANYGGQTGQVFTSSINGSLTMMEGILVGFDAGNTMSGALVQLYNFSGGVVGSLVGQQTVTGTLTDLGFGAVTNFSGYEGYDMSANVNIAGLVAGNQYVATIQGQGGNWAFMVANADGNQNTFIRDYSSFGNGGVGFGASWAELSTLGYSSGDTMTRIQGTAAPEPASLALLSLGGLALIRRRRK